MRSTLFRAFAIAAALAGSSAAANAAMVISSAPTSNVSCSKATCTATAANAVLNVTHLQNMLARANPKLVSGSAANDIVISAALTWVSSHTLTLDAYHSIIVNNPVTITGTGGLTLLTNDGGAGGTFSFGAGGNVVFWDLSSKLTINGAPYTLVNNIASLTSDIAANPNRNYALANSYDASVDGTYTHTPITTEFAGTFEGLGNVISNLTINDLNDSEVAFFATVAPTGIIHDFELGALNVSTHAPGVGQLAGLVGENFGNIARAHVAGQVKGYTREGMVGGLVALNEGTIVGSYSTADVSFGKKSASIGGLVGENDGTIASSFASGKVSANGLSSDAGGLVGANSGHVINCYATGSVHGVDVSYGGGLIGDISSGGTVENSYSTGTVLAANDIGGLLGVDFGSGGITDTYWDITTSGITNLSQGAGNVANDPGITGLSTTQLRSGLPTGFDPSIWAESATINKGLPYLLDIPPT